MSKTLCIVAFAFLGQSPDAERLPYMFALRNGDVVYAFVDSTNDVESQLNRSRRIDVKLAAPWLPERERVKTYSIRDLADPVQISRANSNVYASYLRRGWEENGGVEVETASGETLWVHGAEEKLHQRALAMYAEAFPPPEALKAPPLEPGEAEGPSFLQSWGLHIGVIGIGFMLTALTVWLAFVRKPWGSVKS